MEIICARGTCGLRVHERYFFDKTQFTPGICPNDNGPVTIVDDGTDRRLGNMKVDVDPSSHNYRRVVEVRE